MSKSTISHETALDLKSTALAFQEADSNLRAAGDTVEGVVEAAAAEYLERRAAHQAQIDKAEGEYDGDPADADTSADENGDVAEEVAEKPADRAAADESKDEDAEKAPQPPGDKAKDKGDKGKS